MASRRPTVASDQPITKEILSHGVHGLLYPPGDITGLVESIRKLLLNRDTAIELGAQARIHLEKSLSLNYSIQSLSEYYEKLIGKPKSEEMSSEAQKQKPTVIVQKPPEKLDESIKSPLPPPPTILEPFALSEDTAPFFMKDDGPPTQPAVSVPLQFTEEDTAETDIQFLPVAEPVPVHSGEGHDLAQSPTTPNAEDQWQVMELSQVDLSLGMAKPPASGQPQSPAPDEKKKSSLGTKKASAKKSGAGPITQEIVVTKPQNILIPSPKPPLSPTKPGPVSKPSAAQESPNDLELIPDADVELIDSEDK